MPFVLCFVKMRGYVRPYASHQSNVLLALILVREGPKRSRWKRGRNAEASYVGTLGFGAGRL